MKRVNLLEYFELAELMKRAEQATALSSNSGGTIWFSTMQLPEKLREFVDADNGFFTCKHVATELADAIDLWVTTNLTDRASPPKIESAALERDFQKWQYGSINSKVTAFKSVFAAECRDVDVYSVEQVAIYKTSALVSNGAGVIPQAMHSDIPPETLAEFNNAGKCLAFDLPTACGFHALRGLELMMDAYLKAFGVNTSELKSWHQYIAAAQKLITNVNANKKPSAKVAAMLDRMRELDRNPLMHPRDTLDAVQASMLFSLSAITVVELARDMKANASAVSLSASVLAAIAEQAPALPSPKAP